MGHLSTVVCGFLVGSFMPTLLCPALSAQATDTKLLADDGAAYDQFGGAVATSTERVAIGAHLADGSDFNTGKVYVWRYVDDVLQFETELVPEETYINDHFGLSVDLDDDVLVVGSSSSDGNTHLESRGAVHVFRSVDGAWIEEDRIVPPALKPYARFGAEVDVRGDTLIAGAPGFNLQHGGDGMAYIFRRVDDRWILKDQLQAGVTYEDQAFGHDVQIQGRTAAIAAVADGEGALGAGAVFIFRETEDERWIQRQKLISPDIENWDSFGDAIALDGPWLAVGTPHDDHAGNSTGAVYMYRRQAGQWTLTQKLLAPDAQKNGWFGRAVSLQNGRLIVGALNADQGLAGTAYMFRWTGNTWLHIDLTIPRDLAAVSEFGTDLDFNGREIVAGAPYDPETAEHAGSAFVLQTNDAGMATETDPLGGPTGSGPGPMAGPVPGPAWLPLAWREWFSSL